MLGDVTGRVAEWLCSGLQIRVRRFNSDLGLQMIAPHRLAPCGVFCVPLQQPVAERRERHYVVGGDAERGQRPTLK